MQLHVGRIFVGPSAPRQPEPPQRPAYRYDHAEWLEATSFDWIEQPLTAIADAFFDLITHHHDAVRQRRGRQDS
jgi:hypothetical protein